MVKPGRSLLQVESKWNKTGVHVCFIESCDRPSYVDGDQWTVLGFSTASDGRRVKLARESYVAIPDNAYRIGTNPGGCSAIWITCS